jgi:hypothetical protein
LDGERTVDPSFTVPGTREWAETKASNARAWASMADNDVRPLVQRYQELREHEAWLVLLDNEPRTAARFCSEVIVKPQEWLELMERGVRVLEHSGHEGTVTEEQATLAAHGSNRDEVTGRWTDRAANSSTVDRRFGTTESYTRARLTRDHPALAESVERGELSAHAAAIQAGFHRKMMSVPADDIEALASALKRRMSLEQLQALVSLLRP